MKIPRTGPVWFFCLGIPILALCVVGGFCSLIHFTWLEDLCFRWIKELNEN